MIIPVPAPMGGAIVLGESVIAYMGHGQQMKCTEITPTIIRVTHALNALSSHNRVQGHFRHQGLKGPTTWHPVQCSGHELPLT